MTRTRWSSRAAAVLPALLLAELLLVAPRGVRIADVVVIAIPTIQGEGGQLFGPKAISLGLGGQTINDIRLERWVPQWQ